MNINNNNRYIEGGVVVETTPTPTTTTTTTKLNNYNNNINLQIFLLKSLKNSVFRSIYYILYSRGFLYKKELEKIFLNKISNQILLLEQKGIIKEVPINRDYANILYSQNGYNYHNVNKIKVYSFTEFGFNCFLSHQDMIKFQINPKVRKFIEKTKNLKNTIKEREDLRYRILLKKSNSMLTPEDLVFIEMYKKENDKN